ncbi:hypothetical protein Dimus_001424 [Dionaea muscipula]
MEQLVNFIIRPPRAEYSPDHDLLDDEFMLKGKWYKRKDIEIKNIREDVLQCSHYIPTESPAGNTLPCVIYCHGNSGCRADASEAAIILLPLNITVFTLDFSGSGLSGGEHVTLGWNEKDDLRAVVDYLRADGNVSMIGLWGRSMGAVTSLMYGAEDPSIAGMVLDSPFSDLVDLMMELVETYKVRLPRFTVKFAIQYMRKAIQKKAKFDIMDLNTIKVANSCFVPVLLGHAIDDDFIQPHHSERILDAYAGDKNIIKFEGDHNSPRPQFYFDSISIFFNNVLQPPVDGLGEAFFDPVHDYIDRATWNALHGIGHMECNFEGPATSTVDAIQQLRSRRPMSRMEVPPDIATGDGERGIQEDGTQTDSSTSSSKMINFELSNGHLSAPHVPSSLEDDHFVEYPLDYSADFPCDLEEEERMLMEALMESLKDLDTSCTRTEEPTTASHAESDASTNENSQPPNSYSTSTSATFETGFVSGNSPQESGAWDADSLATAVVCASSSGSETISDSVHGEASVACASSSELETIADSVHGEASSAADVRPCGVNIADGTKATVTLTVEKNPPSNVIDSLFRRWERSFSRSSR